MRKLITKLTDPEDICLALEGWGSAVVGYYKGLLRANKITNPTEEECGILLEASCTAARNFFKEGPFPADPVRFSGVITSAALELVRQEKYLYKDGKGYSLKAALRDPQCDICKEHSRSTSRAPFFILWDNLYPIYGTDIHRHIVQHIPQLYPELEKVAVWSIATKQENKYLQKFNQGDDIKPYELYSIAGLNPYRTNIIASDSRWVIPIVY